jgi:hypothetical protein
MENGEWRIGAGLEHGLNMTLGNNMEDFNRREARRLSPRGALCS